MGRKRGVSKGVKKDKETMKDKVKLLSNAPPHHRYPVPFCKEEQDAGGDCRGGEIVFDLVCIQFENLGISNLALNLVFGQFLL